jgi:predicted dehydrogenase
MKSVSLLVIGGGGRGHGYSTFTVGRPEWARVVGVAEPRDFYRERMVREHSIPAAAVFRDWREAAGRPRMADAVLICTQDAMHEEPAIAFAGLGYHILLEKPMAPTADACRRIVAAAKKAGTVFGVCHVMRYTGFTRALKQVLDSGAVGEIMNVQHMEPVGYWHQAHSFVRGSWRNEAESSFMLLAKSCHDIDWLRYIVGRPCRRVSSFGSLSHFRRERQPAGAADRCLDCGVEASCPYSAKRIYFSRLARKEHGWPLNVVTQTMTEEALREALATGPYGRCVYACDNDVVDHQVVNLEYAGGVSASFTMSAFSATGGRLTRIGGTRGFIEANSSVIKLYDFLTATWREIDTRAADASIMGGHGGGDGGIMEAFIGAVASGDRSRILSGPDETLESHLTVFAAEDARRRGCVVEIG